MIGTRLRHYVIAEKLGEGGMGVVWKARDLVLQRDVALKILPADGTRDEVRRERFLREARAASALNHPNIVTVFEINSDGDVDFIAMELVDGETLAERLSRGQMPFDEALGICRQIADALARAHRAGIVHRDLKPGNVMISRDGLVKVLDFGLAKVEEASAASDQTGETTRLAALTRAGTALGTLGYMSPEQAIGDAADARSDVFSFGVMLYQMIAGALPFQGHTNTELLRALHFSEPEPLEAVRPDVPSWITAVVAKALAKDPGDRFATMEGVAAALRGSVVEAAPNAAPASASSTVRPRRLSWAGSFSVLAVLGAVVLSAWVLVPWRAGRSDDTRTGRVAGVEAGSAYELSQQAATLLARDDQDGNLDEAIRLLEAAVAKDRTHALSYAFLADAYTRQHVKAPDGQWLKMARETVQRALTLNSDLAAAHLANGWVLRADGRAAEGEAAFERAADLDPTNPYPHLGMAVIRAADGTRDVEAEAAFRRAIELDPTEWHPHHEFAEFLYRRARYADAAAEWENVRRLTPDNFIGLRSLSAAYFYLGRTDEAASVLQRSLEIQQSAATYTNLGTIRFFQGRYADAVSMFEKAVELGATRHINWANLGDGLRWAPGRRAEAPAAYRRASALISEQIAQRPDDPDLRSRHAMYLAKMGDTRRALDEIADIVNNATLTAQQLYRLTIAYELAGDRPRALEALERSLKNGYPVGELSNEPELRELRRDVRYQRLLNQF